MILNGACINISNLPENIAWKTQKDALRPEARGPLKSGAWGGRPTCHHQTPPLLVINNDCFPDQHKPAHLYNGYAVHLLWCRDWIFKVILKWIHFTELKFGRSYIVVLYSLSCIQSVQSQMWHRTCQAQSTSPTFNKNIHHHNIHNKRNLQFIYISSGTQ